MRRKMISLCLFSLLANASTNEELILKKLNQMEQKIDGLEKTISNLETKLDKTLQANAFAEDLTNDHVSKKANFEILREIKLPNNPKKTDVIEYLNKIAEASQDQNFFSSTDIQVAMIKKIPIEFLEVVMAYPNHKLDFHVEYAVSSMITKEHKNLVIKNLLKNTDLIDKVVMYDWKKDAKEMVKRGLEINDHLPDTWLSVALSYKDPEIDKAILRYVTKNCNIQVLGLLMISDISLLEIKTAVLKNWMLSKYKDPWQRNQSAVCAVQFGDKLALKTVINLMNDESSRNSYYRQQAIPILLKVLNYPSGDLMKYYESNKELLKFNDEKGYFEKLK